MKKMRILCLLLALTFLCPLLAGCEKRNRELTMGLGVVGTPTWGKDGSFTVTVCAVAVDRKGEIRQITLDVIECAASIGAGGSVSTPRSYTSKREQGYFYGMQAYSPIEKEWHQQADAFCYFALGKTADNLAGLVDEQGKTTDSTLTSICSIGISDFVKAAVRAIENADVTVSRDSTLSLGLLAEDGGSASATDSAAGKYAVDLTVAAVAAKDGIIDAAITDVLQMSCSVSATGAVSAPAELKIKDELGDDYGMKAPWGSEREWYEHNDAFCAYAKGKNAATLLGLADPDNDEKPSDDSLLTSCTIGVSDLCRAVVKALNAQD